MFDRRNRRAERSIILLALIFVVLTATSLYAFLQLRVDQISDSLKKKLPINVLFIVSDRDAPLYFEVFFYNPETKRGALFHVPTNLGGMIQQLNRVEGIGALYSRSNPGPLKKRLEEILGVSIPCVIDIGTEDLRRLVDLIGGLNTFIANPVDMEWKGRRILLPSGSVTLDGDKAIDFVSYEDSMESEADNVGRKQKLLQALLRGLGENSVFLQQRAVFRVFSSLLRTNLPSRALGSFVAEMGKFDAERMILQRVLGTNRLVDGRALLFPHQEGGLLREAVKQTMEANASSEYVPPEELTITVEVLNGTKTQGLAAGASAIFNSYDLEVLAPGNAESDSYDNTVVLDRKGKLEDAKRVADIIHCTRVYTQLDPQMDQAVDVTVILGKDFDGRYVRQ
jgi:anionic cell wall polymer biosynthesis LytR-Cps2A-Psr (LCP) family protein